MTVGVRPASPADEDFIRRLILETVSQELGASAWPEPMRSHLLEIQYTARRQPAAACCVIQADGTDAGWAIVNTMPHEVRVVEIMVSPTLRGKGIGSAAIHQVLATAAAERKPVRLHVNVTNPGAIRLYERLGFRKIDGDEVQYLMEYSVCAATSLV